MKLDSLYPQGFRLGLLKTSRLHETTTSATCHSGSKPSDWVLKSTSHKLRMLVLLSFSDPLRILVKHIQGRTQEVPFHRTETTTKMLESSPKIGMFKRKQILNFSKASYSLSILNFQGGLHVKPNGLGISLDGSSHPCIPAPGDVGDPNHISAAKDAQLLEFEGW